MSSSTVFNVGNKYSLRDASDIAFTKMAVLGIADAIADCKAWISACDFMNTSKDQAVTRIGGMPIKEERKLAVAVLGYLIGNKLARAYSRQLAAEKRAQDRAIVSEYKETVAAMRAAKEAYTI